MKRTVQAVILAGGQGTRLRPLTNKIPKPMIRFYGKPFLEHLIYILKQNNITHIVLLVGYLHEKIEHYFGDGKKFGISIIYKNAGIEADTGTRIRDALPLLDSHFLLLYCDNLWPLQLNALTNAYQKSKKKALVTVYTNRDNATKNNVQVSNTSLITIYDRKRTVRNLNGVDIGYFLMNKNIFVKLPKTDFSFEDTIIMRLVKEKQLTAFVTDQKYYGLSTLKRIPSIKKYLRPKKVIFLDRDGVINKRPTKAEYIHDWKQFVFLPHAKKALQLLVKKGYTLYILSNQAGIGRKIITKRAVDALHTRLRQELSSIGVAIKGIYICPHGWDEGCLCRKPNSGLFFQAARDHGINLTESICIGDDVRDIIAGKRAACKTIYIGDEPMNDFSPSEKPDTIFKTLYDAALQL